MAVDKLVDSNQLNADLTSVANAIRTKGGTSDPLAFPNGFVSAVNSIPTGGSSGGNFVILYREEYDEDQQDVLMKFDKTLAEVTAAVNEGKNVFVVEDVNNDGSGKGERFLLVSYNDDYFRFVNIAGLNLRELVYEPNVFERTPTETVYTLAVDTTPDN